MKKTKQEELVIEKPIDIINKYYKLFLTCGSTLCIVILYILRFFEYITASYYFSYYGLNIGLYRYNDPGFIYSLCFSIIFLVAFISILFSANSLTKKLKEKVNRKIIGELLVLVFYNIILSFVYFRFVDLFNFTIFNIILLIIELVYSYFLFKKDEITNNEDAKIKIKNYFKALPFLIIILLLLYGGRTYSQLKLIRNYNIIGNDKVIVYSNNDYYITLDCNIKDNNLIIYKGKQEKIDNKDVYTISRTFEKVELR